MNPMKRVPVIRPPAPAPNLNPLTRADMLRIIENITCDGNSKGMMECVCQDDPGRWAVDEFLEDCRDQLIDYLRGRIA